MSGIETMSITSAGRTVTFSADDAEAMRRAVEGLAADVLPTVSLGGRVSPHRVASRDDGDELICPQFAEDFREWKPLARLGAEIIERYEEFADLRDGAVVIRYLWKRKGGASGGNSKLGKLTKASGMGQYFGVCDYVVWLARDHAMHLELTDTQIEALLYHELLHINREEDEFGIATWGTQGHDTEVFYREIERYGWWRSSLAMLAQVARTVPLPGFDVEPSPPERPWAAIVDRLVALESVAEGAGVEALANELAWVRRRLQFGQAEAERIEAEMGVGE